MTLYRLLFGTLALFLAGQSPASSCGDLVGKLLRPLETIQGTFGNKGQQHAYTQIKSKNPIVNVPLQMPELKESFLIVVNKRAHVSIWYQGYKLQATGTIGFLKSVMEKTDEIEGLMAFAISGLTPDQKAHFFEVIRGFKSEWHSTCSSYACHFINRMNALDIEQGFETQALTRQLVEISMAAPDKVKIITMGTDFPSAYQTMLQAQKIKTEKTLGPKYLLGLLLGSAGALTGLVSWLL